jgi:RimJ/RimL family protein N-acetyltransferase
MPQLTVRLLCPDDVSQYRALRLLATQESPTSVWASYEEESAQSQDAMAQRLVASDHQWMFGAFDNNVMVGIAGLRRDKVAKIAHRAGIWGVYVAPDARGFGAARQMMEAMLAHVRTMPQLVQLTLSVRSTNEAAKALYQRLGFARTGVDPRSMCIDGVYHDEERMVLLLDR